MQSVGAAMAALVRLLGGRLLTRPDASLPTVEALKGASVVGLYFSASWCPPCRGFTPSLIQSYSGALELKGMRCVFVSWDRDEKSFADYYDHMPWLALPFELRSRNELLGQRFGVRSIPTLALVDMYGRTITTAAREAVVSDPSGRDYPWTPARVRDLADGDPGELNRLPSVLCLCEAAGPAAQQLAVENLNIVAKEFEEREVAAAAEQATPELPETPEALREAILSQCGHGFLVGTGGPLSEQVRRLCKLPVGGPPQLLLLDIPADGGFYLGPQGDEALAVQSMHDLLGAYKAKQLARHQMQPPSE